MMGLREDVNSKAKHLVKMLCDKNISVSTMESCTGGLIISKITDNPGSSQITRGGSVVYSNYSKMMMGVEKSILDEFTAYSFECVEDMSFKTAINHESLIGVSTSGYIENDGYNVYTSICVVGDSKEESQFINKRIYGNGYTNREDNKMFIVNELVDSLIFLVDSM